jgi:hypothetical protein
VFEDNKIKNTTLKELSEDDYYMGKGLSKFNQILGEYLKVFTVLERLKMSILYEENLTQYIIDYLKDNRHSRQQNAKKINISSTTDIMKVYEQLPRFVIKSIVLSEKHSRDDIHKMMLLWIQAMKKKIFLEQYLYSIKFGKKEEIAVRINEYIHADRKNQFKTGGEPNPGLIEKYSKRTLYGEFKRVSEDTVKEIKQVVKDTNDKESLLKKIRNITARKFTGNITFHEKEYRYHEEEYRYTLVATRTKPENTDYQYVRLNDIDGKLIFIMFQRFANQKVINEVTREVNKMINHDGIKFVFNGKFLGKENPNM